MVMFTALPRVLKDSGSPFTLVPGWASRTAHKGGMTANLGTLWHTTETADAAFRTGEDAPTLGFVTNGDGYNRYNILIGRSGRLYLIAVGTAGHAGVGSAPGIPNDDGNRHMLGVAFDANSWDYPVTTAQLESAARLGAAIDRDWGRPGTGRHLMHGEWAPGRRSDPTRVPGGWNALRAAISRGYWATPLAVAKPAPAPKPTANPEPQPAPKEWSDMATKQEIQDAVRDVVRQEIATARAQKTVTWPDSTTGETKKFTDSQALGYLGEHWKRETERDAAEAANRAG